MVQLDNQISHLTLCCKVSVGHPSAQPAETLHFSAECPESADSEELQLKEIGVVLGETTGEP